jgi:hypothetical protein
VVARPRTVQAPAGKAVFTWWPELALPGLPAISPGAIPAPVPVDDPLYASFGASEVRNGARRNRPARKRKSPLLVRLKRWFTGY